MIFVPFIALASFLQFVHPGEQKKAKDILPGPAETGLKDANGLLRSLFQEWNGKIASVEWTQHPEYFFESILAAECEIAQNWQNPNSVEEHNDENLAKLTDEANKLCGAKNKMEYLKQNSQIAQRVPEFFHNDASKVVEGLKKMEIEDDTLAKLGQLTLQHRSKRGAAEVQLFDGAQLRTIVTVSNLLCLVETKMDSGPAKKVMSKALGRRAVLLPSQLMELAIELWKVVVEGQEQRQEEDAVAQQHAQAKSAQLQRKAQSQKAKDQKQFQQAVFANGHRRRRRRMDKEVMTRHLTGFAMCLPIIIFAMYILSWLMAGVSSAANWLSELFWHPVTMVLLSAGLYLCIIKPHILPQFLRQLVKNGLISKNTSRRIKSHRFGFS